MFIISPAQSYDMGRPEYKASICGVLTTPFYYCRDNAMNGTQLILIEKRESLHSDEKDNTIKHHKKAGDDGPNASINYLQSDGIPTSYPK